MKNEENVKKNIFKIETIPYVVKNLGADFDTTFMVLWLVVWTQVQEAIGREEEHEGKLAHLNLFRIISQSRRHEYF